MSRRYGSLVSWVALSCLAMSAAEAEIVTQTLEGGFEEVSESVRAAIVGKGINIAHVLESGDMLHRTGPAYGYEEDIYSQALTYQFCSAKLSHQLARFNPEHIVLCPFTIAVYRVVGDEEGSVRVSYSIPEGSEGSESISTAIGELLQSIIEDASW
ncbi:DUF302 domain-containing protein [Ectothiorhodospiraceae bacterium BW-2]|nr:DUF302 domain-containing protein [Ectothiorhodospiraceae bacterium BW-2]